VQPFKNPPHFMEPEGSIPCSQKPSTGPYPEPYQSTPSHPISLKIHFNIVHPPTSWSTKPLTKISTRDLLEGKKRSARRADNLAAICEPNV
jgi:hypothetical protein